MPENFSQRKTSLLSDQAEKPNDLSFKKESPNKDSDQGLVDRCLNGDRAAWEEFFRRFTPSILKAIQNHLLAQHRYDLIHDEDVLWEIHKRVMEKLYVDDALRTWEDLAGVWVWLKTIVINKTKDWLRETEGRKKRLAQRQAEESTLRLSTPLGENSEKTLEDVIPAESPPDQAVTAYLKKALQEISSMGQEKKEWVLRLSLLLYRRLSEVEVEALAAFSGYSREEVEARIEAMTEEAGRKEKRRAREESQAVQYWCEIRQMEKVIIQRKQVDTGNDTTDLKSLKKKVALLERKREDLIRKSRKIVRPSNRAIGEMIGLPDDQVDQVSNLLNRAKRDLEKRMGGGPSHGNFEDRRKILSI